jgi:acetylornithine/succinyldiaminopimelate/putrescine aminotransferase
MRLDKRELESMADSQLCGSYVARLKKHECPDSTFGSFDPPLVLDKALGSQIKTVSGNILIDLCAGFGVLALGHNHPRILSRLNRLETEDWPTVMHGMGDVYPSRAKVEFFELLKSILPEHLSLGSLALSGSQAIEIAIKSAILSSKKTGFLTVAGGYHGLDLGTLPLTANLNFRAPFEGYLRPTSVTIAPGCDKGSISNAIRHLESIGAGFAGVVVEPIQGRAGVNPLDFEWIRQLGSMAKSHGGCLILDEVFCGLGRAGQMTFAEELDADITCLGKALGGGVPLSVCIGRESIMKAWPESQGEALHTGTFFGHPLGCELAIETLNAIVEMDLCKRSIYLGSRIKSYCEDQLSAFGILIRGSGLMIGLDYQKSQRGVLVMDQLRKEGVLALVSGARGECLSITPALNIPEQTLWSAMEKVVNVSLKFAKN